ncbi:MAG: FAD-binding oxidoreductase [Gemmataceae bacterium]
MLQRPLDFTEYKRHQLAKHLARHFEGEVRFDETSRKLYSTDASIYEVRPLGILLPKTQTDLAMGVQLCLELELPIIPRGAGTSVSGQSLGNGIVIDCSKYLNRVIALDPDNRRVVVEPGVTLDQLNRETGKHGLQFGASWNRGTLGGTIGNNSAGARSIAFGKPVDQVHRLQVLLSDGASATFDSLTQHEWALK